MEFQARDGHILEFIYDMDGAVSRRHIKERFWPKAVDDRSMDKRLSKLKRAGYVSWPTKNQYREHPVPRGERIVWLDWKGILWRAKRRGVYIQEPPRINERQLRLLAQGLRKKDIRWLRRPRWIQLAHDLAVIDFRLAVERAVGELPHIVLEKWVAESALRADADEVKYRVKGGDGQVRQGKARIIPDGYFVVSDVKRRALGKAHRARFLLEMDRGSEDLPRWGREKALLGVPFIQSPAYQNKFGDNSGRWLVVTSGRVRREHLMEQAQRVAGSGAKAFLFTTMRFAMGKENILTAPIWWQVGTDNPVDLF